MKNAAPLVIAAALLWYGLTHRSDSPPGPGPGPGPQPSSVRAAFDDYRERMAVAYGEGAAMDFPSDRAAFDWIKARAETERSTAFAPVHKREQDTFGGEKWDDAKRQKLWAQFAEEAR